MLIYVITNNLSGKQYVGQTIRSLEQRWQHHCWLSTSKTNMPIALAIQKYGKENFSISAVEWCNSLECLNEREIYWANLLNTFSPNGYNLKAGSGKGAMTDETKRKISVANKGRKASAETKRKLSESHMGYIMSDTTKQKLSRINSGKPGSALCYQRAREAQQGTYDLLSPDGDLIRVINMKAFCKAHNLSPSKMCLVVNGKRTHHRGWTGKRVTP